MAVLKDELRGLMLAWQQRQITRSEAIRLWTVTTEQQSQQALSEVLKQHYDEAPEADFFTTEQKNRLHEFCTKHANLRAEAGSQPQAAANKNPRISWKWLAAATVLLAIGLTYTRHVFKSRSSPLQKTPIALRQDITPPKSNHAILTLGIDSEAIALGKDVPGIIAQKKGVKIRRGKDGCIIYDGNTANDTHTATPTTIQLNTLTVPKGSRPVQIQLPDGTHVWVNAASSLRFPTVFKGNTRNVYLLGEAYFEVFHKQTQPFIIHQGTNTVRVLGTHFNVDAYKDNQATRVTLLQGSVSVNDGLKISPGQQAVLLRNGKVELNSHPDLREVMAWRNNKFMFNGANADQILRQLSRWYNVEIIYSGKIPEGHFSGLLDKDNNLSTVLKILESGGLRFKIDQNRLIVL